MPGRLLNIKEAQAVLDISESTMFRLIKSRKLQGFKVGREWRFEESDIDTFIDEQRKKAQEEISRVEQEAKAS